MFVLALIILIAASGVTGFIWSLVKSRRELIVRCEEMERQPRLIRVSPSAMTFSSLPNDMVSGEPIALSSPIPPEAYKDRSTSAFAQIAHYGALSADTIEEN